MKFALIGSGSSARPVPQKIKPVIVLCLRESGGSLQSALRNQEAVNFARSRGAVLSSQPELWQAAQNGTGNPANPPGYSTHELRSDGIAYPSISRGLPIPDWAVGLDIGSVSGQAFCNAAREEGWVVTVTYPSSESWHVNFRKRPKFNPWKLIPLKRGKRGSRVHKLTRYLSALEVLDGHARRKFDEEVEDAVRAFQREHKLPVDGVVGIHTWRQVQSAFRKHKRDGKGHRPGHPDR